MLNRIKFWFKYPAISRLNFDYENKSFRQVEQDTKDQAINKKIMVFGGIVAVASVIMAITSIISCHQSRNTYKIEIVHTNK